MQLEGSEHCTARKVSRELNWAIEAYCQIKFLLLCYVPLIPHATDLGDNLAGGCGGGW